MANVIQTFPRGTGGGHTILDTTGSPVTDRKEMQFKGLSVTDNSTDEVTEIGGVGLNQDSLNDIASANISNVMVGSGLNYSTSEQIVGRWIDGLPIYQKTISATCAKNTNITIPHNITNFGNIVRAEGSIMRRKVTPTSNDYVLTYNSGSEVLSIMGIGSTTVTVRIGGDFQGPDTNVPVYVTLYYTKTT